MNLIKNNWNNQDYKDFLEHLKNLSEESYKKFNSNIIPNTPNMIGVRVPILKDIAKKISKGNAIEFLKLSKGNVHEELIVEGLVIGNLKIEYDEFLEYIKDFSKKVYNWAICDCTVSSWKIINKNKEQMFTNIDIFLSDENPWIQRVGIIILLDYFLEKKHINEIFKKLDKMQTKEYYVQMAKAWLIATAFAKEKDITLEYLKKGKIDDTTYKMTIRKIRDSYRISDEDKKLILSIR